MTENQTLQDQTVRAYEALEAVRRTHPAPRLFAGHRDAIRVALAEAGVPADGQVSQRVERVLASAQTYEATGMFAFVPNWDHLFARLAPSTNTADGALVS